MKRLNLFLVLILGTVVMLTAQEVTKYDIRTAYVYQDASLLISETDLNCSYFIRKGMSEDMSIIGGDQMNEDKIDYTDGDRVFINRGSKDGIQEGDRLLFLSPGVKVFNRMNSKSLGTLYLKKSQGVVTCLYENRAIVTLDKGCNPVRMGDLAVPFKPQNTVFKKKPIYTRCLLPKNRTEGNVIYSSMHNEAERFIMGPNEYVTIDLGKALVSNGDLVLFYILFRNDLPPIINGTGIVLDAENNNATVKILDAGYPIEIGTKLLVLKEEDLRMDTTRASKMRRLTGEEKVPIIEKLEEEGGEASGVPAGEETLELNVLFDLNESSLKAEYQADLEKISEFLQGKSQFVIILRGYSCSIGNPEYNLKLSKDRVENIKKYLMDKFNIKEDFFETYFYGEKESPYDNTSEEERRKNRLVNIQVLGR